VENINLLTNRHGRGKVRLHHVAADLDYLHSVKILYIFIMYTHKKDKKAQLMLAYPRDAKTMKKIPPFRSYNKFQSTRKSGVYSRPN